MFLTVWFLTFFKVQLWLQLRAVVVTTARLSGMPDVTTKWAMALGDFTERGCSLNCGEATKLGVWEHGDSQLVYGGIFDQDGNVRG